MSEKKANPSPGSVKGLNESVEGFNVNPPAKSVKPPPPPAPPKPNK